MSWSTIIMIAIIGAICYYGWSFIEAILILLPIPDPKEGLNAIKHLGN